MLRHLLSRATRTIARRNLSSPVGIPDGLTVIATPYRRLRDKEVTSAVDAELMLILDTLRNCQNLHIISQRQGVN